MGRFFGYDAEGFVLTHCMKFKYVAGLFAIALILVSLCGTGAVG